MRAAIISGTPAEARCHSPNDDEISVRTTASNGGVPGASEHGAAALATASAES